MKSYITIPYNIIRFLDKDKKDYKILEFYFKLKGLYDCGCIKNYRKEYNKISKKLLIGESTVRMKISQLKENNLVYFSDDKKHMFLRSKFQLMKYVKHSQEVVNMPLKELKTWKLKTIRYRKSKLYKVKDDLYFYLHGLKLYDNIHVRQKNAYFDKYILNNSTGDSSEIKRGCYYATLKSKISALSSDRFVIEDKKRLDNLILLGKVKSESESNDSILSTQKRFNRNPNFTLSRKGMARTCARKSRGYGINLIRKLKEKGLISKDEKNEKLVIKKYVKNNNLDEHLYLLGKEYNYGMVFNFPNKNYMVIRYSNNVRLNLDVNDNYTKGYFKIDSIY